MIPCQVAGKLAISYIVGLIFFSRLRGPTENISSPTTSHSQIKQHVPLKIFRLINVDHPISISLLKLVDPHDKDGTS